jgi:hypothetical protein
MIHPRCTTGDRAMSDTGLGRFFIEEHRRYGNGLAEQAFLTTPIIPYSVAAVRAALEERITTTLTAMGHKPVTIETAIMMAMLGFMERYFELCAANPELLDGSKTVGGSA